MSEEPSTLFVYHTDRRRRLRGCMPLFVFVSAVLVVGGIMLVPVRLSPKEDTPRTGRIYFRNDPLLHFNLRQMSPSPFELPRFVDPASRNFGKLDAALMPESRLLRVEPPSPFSGGADTFVLEHVDLLELPPLPESLRSAATKREGGADGRTAKPDTGTGEKNSRGDISGTGMPQPLPVGGEVPV